MRGCKNISFVAALTLSAALLATGCGSANTANADSMSDNGTVTAVEETGHAASEESVAEEAKSEETKTEEVKAEDNEANGGNEDGSKTEEVSDGEAKTEDVNGDSLFSEVSSEGFSVDNALKGKKSALPAYEYPGPEQFYSVLYQYIIDEFGQYYLQGDVCIPCPIIVAEDDSNKDDMRMWGNFEVYNYTLSGDTLMTVSGGSHPGCIHFKMADGGFEVTGFDAVADGSDYEPTAKKIFGDKYDTFVKTMGDDKSREDTRAQIISNYAAANNLQISGYQDYGWEKIALPNENIDTFYSTLD